MALVPVCGDEPESFYSLAAVSAIDRENSMLRLVDANGTVDDNVRRLLAAGFPKPEVEALRPQMLEMWSVEFPLQLDWLARDTLEQIRELEPGHTVRMRNARINEALLRLGGARESFTPSQVAGGWRKAILQLLNHREIKEFILLNSGPALAMQELMKNLSLTQDERRTLCLWQQDYHGVLFQIRSDNGAQPATREPEALLDYRRQMRTLLGDDRFAAYLRLADLGFDGMAEVLEQIDGTTRTQALELWWIRKTDELADARMVLGSARYQIKIKTYESAAAILGPIILGRYEADEDAQWLRRNHPYRLSNAEVVAQQATVTEETP